jgi:hypothetical protein
MTSRRSRNSRSTVDAYRGGGGHPVAEPVGPLHDHLVPHQRSHGRRRATRAAKHALTVLPVKVRLSNSERSCGSKSPARPPGSRRREDRPPGARHPLRSDDLTRAGALCRALGYEPVFPGRRPPPRLYLAGTDQERLDDLNAALNDPLHPCRLVHSRRLRLDPDPRSGRLPGPRAPPQAAGGLLRHHGTPHRGGRPGRRGRLPWARGTSRHARLLARALRAGAGPTRARRPVGPPAPATRRTNTPGEPDRHPRRRHCGGPAFRRQPQSDPVLLGRRSSTSGAILFLEDVGETSTVDRMLATTALRAPSNARRGRHQAFTDPSARGRRRARLRGALTPRRSVSVAHGFR